MGKSAAPAITSHFGWVSQMISKARGQALNNSGLTSARGKSLMGCSVGDMPIEDSADSTLTRGKSVTWHDVDERQIRERDLYNELLRRLSINTGARDDLLFLFLQIFCAENQDFDFADLAPKVDQAFSVWVTESLKSRDPLLMGDSCACIRLARLERKMSHVLCLLTLIMKSTLDVAVEDLSKEVFARSFVVVDASEDESMSMGKVLESLLQMLLALWSQISAVKLQITTQYSYYKQSSTVQKYPDLDFSSSEALRLIVSKLPPT